MKRMGVVLLLTVLLITSGSWGFLVHRTVNQLAVYQLPKGMQGFYYKNMDYVVKNSVRPDQRRNEDPSEATKHFIDLEAFGDSAAWKMPMDWETAVKEYSRDSLIKYGYVPYYVIVEQQRLTQAFKSGNKDSILFYSADIAHYIGDAHVPLHTSINYDGQLTNQRGLHALWETVVPEIVLPEYNLSSRHKAKYLKHSDVAIWEAVRSGFVLLKDVFEQEREATKMFTDETKYRIQMRNGKEVKYYTSDFAKEYSKRLGPTINQQLNRSASLVADFWYTCWVDAGRPDLSKIMTQVYSNSDKDQFQLEKKAFRKNELLKKQLLISKKNSGAGE